MLNKDLLRYFSHSGQEITLLSSGQYLEVDPTSLSSSTRSRDFTITIPKSHNSVEVQQNNFYAPISASSRVPAWSTASIYDDIHIASSIIRSAANGYIGQHRRLVYAEGLVPYAETLEEEDTLTFYRRTKGYITDIYLKGPIDIENEATSTTTRKQMRKVYNTQSTCSLLQPLATTNNYIDWENIEEIDIVSLSTGVIPGFTDGWLPSSKVGQSMETTTLSAVAWGLQAAVSSEDVYTTVLILRQLVTLTVRYGWIDVQGQLVNQLPSFFGFEHVISIFDRTQHGLYKEVISNAFLGIAVCKALEFLQDKQALHEYYLGGAFYDFGSLLTVLLRGLTRFCAGAVSPEYTVAYKEEFGHYSYGTPSILAEYYVDLFFNVSLAYIYDKSIHVIAAQLHYSVSNKPIDSQHPSWSYYIEQQGISGSITHYPDGYQSPSTAQEQRILYSQKAIAVAQLWWSVFYEDYYVFVSAYNKILQLRTDITFSGLDILDIDTSLACLYVYVRQPQEWVLGNEIFTQLGTTVVYGDYIVPEWFDDLFEQYQLLTLSPNNNACLQYAMHILSNVKTTVPESLLNLEEGRVIGTISQSLNRLRAMMPYGEHWWSQEKVKDITSNIGSLLYSEACLSASHAVERWILEQAVSPHKAVGLHHLRWFNAIAHMSPELSSVHRRRRMLEVLLEGQQGLSLTELPLFLKEFFNVTCSIDFPSIPPFHIYTDSNIVNESASSFLSEPVDISSLSYLTSDMYMSCVYKRLEGKWVLREVAGLPQLSVGEEYRKVTAEQYKEEKLYRVNDIKIAVEDGEIYILPLSYYSAQAHVECLDRLPYYFVQTLNKIVPAGTYLHIKAAHV